MRSGGFHYFGTGLGLEEKVSFLFQPAPLLSAHYFEAFGRKILLESEKRPTARSLGLQGRWLRAS